MVTVILTHEVRNFSEWKTGFDTGAGLREQNGVKINGVYNSVENPNLVTVITEFPSVEAVKGFMANPALKSDMEKAGVVGAPEVKILNKL
ncbi:MAG: cyclase [Sphingobacteriales bacterium]|nr:cyclase [Sphingobacteriales bacterium]